MKRSVQEVFDLVENYSEKILNFIFYLNPLPLLIIKSGSGDQRGTREWLRMHFMHNQVV